MGETLEPVLPVVTLEMWNQNVKYLDFSPFALSCSQAYGVVDGQEHIVLYLLIMGMFLIKCWNGRERRTEAGHSAAYA